MKDSEECGLWNDEKCELWLKPDSKIELANQRIGRLQ